MKTSPEFSCGLILLAAGASRRMGRPKQLLPIESQPLIRHVAGIVLRAPVTPVVVVLGAYAREVAPVLDGLPVTIIVNPDWNEGMGSSLRTGVKAALELAPNLHALIIVLADQPDLPSQHLTKLIQTFQRGEHTIVASQTGDDLVPPVLFGNAWFPRLLTLSGDTGARALLQAHPTDTTFVPLVANTDLDTREDYDRYTGTTGSDQRRMNR